GSRPARPSMNSHPSPLLVVEDPEQKIANRVASRREPSLPHLLDKVPLFSRCKRLDLGPDPLSAMHDVAGINGVPEHGQDSARIDWPAAPLATGFGGEFPGRAAALAKLPCQLIGGRGRKPVEHFSYEGRAFGIGKQAAALGKREAKGRSAADIKTAAHQRGLFVSGPVAGEFALELSESQKDVEDETPHAVRCIESLGDADEAGAIFVERVDQPDEIAQGAAQPVDLVHDNHVDSARLDVADQPFQRRTLEAAAGKSAIVVSLGKFDPVAMRLAH